ncbi:MAG: polysaccharide biosynthesis/export family protein [Chlorobium sp.]
MHFSRKLFILLFFTLLSLAPVGMRADVLAPVTTQSNLYRPYYNPLGLPEYPLTQSSYFTDDNGNILMTINVLGEVNRPGPLVVRESVDLASVLSLAGGTKGQTNLKRVLITRQEPDSNGKTSYIIDLDSYYKKGDRSSFIALKPNDTIVFPEKSISLEKLALIASIGYGVTGMERLLYIVGVGYPLAFLYSTFFQ